MEETLGKILDKVKQHQLRVGQAFKEWRQTQAATGMEGVGMLANVLLFGDLDIGKQLEALQRQNLKVGVCGKLIHNFDVVYTCENCSVISNSVYCAECYIKEMHIGHKVHMESNAIGTCDCGDPDALLQTGFCPKHQGFNEDELSDSLLPPYLRQSYKKVLKNCMKVMVHEVLEDLAESAEGPAIALATQRKEGILLLIQFMDAWQTASPFFIKALCEAFDTRLYSKPSVKHVCTPVAFLSPEEEKQHKQQLERQQKKLPNSEVRVCTCKPLSLLMGWSRDAAYHIATPIYDVLLKLTKSGRFKQLLCQTYLTNYQKIVESHNIHNIGHQDAFRKIALQALSFDETAMLALTSPVLQQCWYDSLGRILTQANPKHHHDNTLNYIWMTIFAQDFTYMLKKKPSRFLVYGSDRLAQYLTRLQSARLDVAFSLPKLDAHVQFDEGFGVLNPLYLFTSKELLRIFRRIIINYDFFDDGALCQPLGKHFKELLAKQYADYTTTQRDNYWVANDLYRCLTIFLTSYVQLHLLPHLFNKKCTSAKDWADLKQELRRLLKAVLCIPSDSELNTFIIQTLEVASRPFVLLLEAFAKRWIYYGSSINQYVSNALEKRHYNGCELDFALIQLLFAAYEGNEEEDGLDMLIKVMDTGKWIGSYFECIKGTKDKLDGINDENLDKVELQIQVFMYFLCGLTANDAASYRSVVRLQCDTEVPQSYKTTLKEEMQMVVKHYLKRVLTHHIFRSKAAIAPFSLFTPLLPKKLRGTSMVEAVVQNLCDTTIGVNSEAGFSVKQENLREYDPYFYCVPYQIQFLDESGQEVLNRCKKQSKAEAFDPLIGSMNEDREDLLGYLPHLVALNILESKMVQYLPWLISSKYFPFGAIKAQPTSSYHTRTAALKLLKLYACNYTLLKAGSQASLVKSIMDNNGQLIRELKELQTANPSFSHSVASVLKQLQSALGSSDLAKIVQQEFTIETPTVTGENASEKKERLRALQEKVMVSFKEKQQQFAEKNIAQMSQLAGSQGEDQKAVSAPGQHDTKAQYAETCMLCKEKIDSTKPYGRITHVRSSHLLYQGAVRLLKKLGEETTEQMLKELGVRRVTKRLTACNHFLHMDCYPRVEKLGFTALPDTYFQCPFCQALANFILPPCKLVLNPSERQRCLALFNVVQTPKPQVVPSFWTSLQQAFGLGTSETSKEESKGNAEYRAEGALELFEASNKMLADYLQLLDIVGLKDFGRYADLHQGLVWHVKSFYRETAAFLHKLTVSEAQKPLSIGHCRILAKLVKSALRRFIIADDESEFKIHLAQQVALAIYATISLQAIRAALARSLDNVGKLTIVHVSTLAVAAGLYKAELLLQLRKFAALFSLLTYNVDLLMRLSTTSSTMEEEIEAYCGLVGFDMSKCQNDFKESAEVPSPSPSNIATTVISQGIAEAQKKAVVNVGGKMRLRLIYLQEVGQGLERHLIPLPEQYTDLIVQYYPRTCDGCQQQRKEKVLCLLCGQVYCVSMFESSFSPPTQCESLASHSMDCCGSEGAFLALHTGEIYLYCLGNYHVTKSPYQNKFGESINRLRLDQKESFHLNAKSYQELEEKIIQGKVAESMPTDSHTSFPFPH